MADDENFMQPQDAPSPARPAQVLRSKVSIAFRQILALAGLIMIVLAIPIAFLTPIIPVGLPLAVLGVVLLGRNAVWGRRWMESVLSRHPGVERFAPNWLMKLVFGREKRPAFRSDTKR